MSRNLHQHQINDIDTKLQGFKKFDEDAFNKLSKRERKLYNMLCIQQGLEPQKRTKKIT